MPNNEEGVRDVYMGEEYVMTKKKKFAYTVKGEPTVAEKLLEHTVPLPISIAVEPFYERDANGKLIEQSFCVKEQAYGAFYYEYAVAVFNFEGHEVVVLGSTNYVTDVIQDTYEHDVFEVGFDKLLIFYKSFHAKHYMEEFHSNSLEGGRTVHRGF
jgi:hypothetical protein